MNGEYDKNNQKLENLLKDKEKPDLAAIAFEISSIYTQAYIDIYNKLIEAEIPHDNATAATSCQCSSQV